MSTERPILFSGPMVRAILEGRKTQTRRVVTMKKSMKSKRYQYDLSRARKDQGVLAGGGGYLHVPRRLISHPNDPETVERVFCPHGDPGDRLWVREEWSASKFLDGHYEPPCHYRADPDSIPFSFGWRRSIHMPRWASRITLEIVSVRVERVKDISEEDAQAEGVEAFCTCGNCHGDYCSSFEKLWDSINAKRGYGWQVNPYVWAITFKVAK